jgi:hypothetical protein
VRDGDAEAFERFCRAEYGSVVRTAWLITGDREAAVDLAQEAFARAFERWASVAELDRPGALDDEGRDQPGPVVATSEAPGAASCYLASRAVEGPSRPRSV